MDKNFMVTIEYERFPDALGTIGQSFMLTEQNLSCAMAAILDRDDAPAESARKITIEEVREEDFPGEKEAA